MSNTYCYLHLRGSGRDARALREALESRTLGSWRQSAITAWGIWEGLFGVASNELLVVATGSGERTVKDFTTDLGAVEVVDVQLIAATVRPVAAEPCEAPGLYVFRFFEVRNADVEEIADLSAAAWETFENTDRYTAEPMGLFSQHDLSSETGRMLLVTWYDGLASWQTSRRPATAAAANFQRRRDLTLSTRALATRLVTLNSTN